ncbi:hypothetical protein, partial [Rhizobium johnstonii]|uniref:hypothetical protein n=1 Tax=Rhizobium johnstonii TaxID=3019933 RepID=UPI003F976738
LSLDHHLHLSDPFSQRARPLSCHLLHCRAGGLCYLFDERAYSGKANQAVIEIRDTGTKGCVDYTFRNFAQGRHAFSLQLR